LLHGGFLLFNPANLGKTRTLMEQSGELIQLIRLTCRIHLNPPVVFISNPAAQTELHSMLFDEPTEANPLHTA